MISFGIPLEDLDRNRLQSGQLTDSAKPDLPHFWKVDRENPQPEVIALAASVLKQGGVVIYPTETFYGVGADPMSESAAVRIYRIKTRESRKPLPLIAADITAVRRAVAIWPSAAERLADAFWPGALTLVLSASSLLPPLVHAHTGKIAIRISSHPVARALSSAAGGLLISTSANPANRPACRLAEEIPTELLVAVDGVIDAGPSSPASEDLPSTIVDVTCMPPRLVRLGRLSWESIRAHCV